MYIQYKPREYVQVEDECNLFYYAIPGFNLIVCDDYKNPVVIARYIGHFKSPDELKRYDITEYQNFFYPNEYWTEFEKYEEDYQIIRDLRANIIKPHEIDDYRQQYPQIFVFDKTITKFIYSGFSMKETFIPVEILNTIPFYKFRLRANDMEYCFEYELGNLLLKTVDEDISICISVCETKETNLNLLLENFIKEKVQLFYKTCKEVYKFSDEQSLELSEKTRHKYVQFIENVIPLILYVSSVNAEIAEKPYLQLVPEYPKEFPDEIVRYVGVKTGYNLGISLKTIQSKSYDIDEDRKVKKPHIRKAHFHHYWVNDNGTDKKKLILKWLAPIIVNGYTGEEKERHIR